MWKVGVVFLILTSCALSASLFECPQNATCLKYGQIESTSLEFLDKLTPKQYYTITHLTVNHASLEKLNPKLKYLRKLEYFNLSHNNLLVSSLPNLPSLKTLVIADNNIKRLRFSDLPSNVEELDISDNLLKEVPKDWDLLKSLKYLSISKNPIDCECSNVLTIIKMRSSRIIIPEPVLCFTSKDFAGKNINSTNCSTDDLMMYDDPEVEGSGATDIFENVAIPHLTEEEEHAVDENTIIDDKVDNDQLGSEFIETKENSPLENDEQLLNIIDVTTAKTILEEEEGSGDEGSGFIDVEIPIIPACHINCSTPGPFGINDEQGASEAPNPVHQLQIIAEDIFGIKGDEPPSSTASPSTSSSVAKEYVPVEVNEIPFDKEVNNDLLRVSDKQNDDVELISHETNPAEKMAKATAINENSYAVYIVVGVGFLLAVVFLTCLVKNRKNKRNNRREIPLTYGEEMKPLSKPTIQAVNEKNGKSNIIPENAPLMNGNGKTKDEPILTAFTPLAHPEVLPSEDGEDEPELRFKPELLTPTTERVTIRASELPDSIPKTPLLVDRKKNSSGEIISTVLPP